MAFIPAAAVTMSFTGIGVSFADDDATFIQWSFDFLLL